LKVKTLGEGEPEYAVMYCVHGNEPCGKLAVERLMQEDLDLNKPLKLVFANEKAYEKGKSQLEDDLNRVWGTDTENTHEERLARKIEEEIRGKKVLDLHSSFSHPEAFGLETESSEFSDRQLKNLGVDKAASIESAYKNQIPDCDRIAVECGYVRSEKTIRNAYSVLKNFLKANGVLTGEADRSEPEKYRIYEKVEGSGYQFMKENFEKVRKGETFAVSKEDELKAGEEFYPVLMSTTGYDNMVGFKARKE
jgi:predicted deacylase